jgi:hypothetical protein
MDAQKHLTNTVADPQRSLRSEGQGEQESYWFYAVEKTRRVGADDGIV